MWKKWTAMALLVALLLAGCGGNQVSPPPGDQISAAEDLVNTQAASLLNDAIGAFDDVLPAELAPQATGTELPPLTLAYNGEERVLIGGPWRPPFPWPLPNGADDLNGKPLFITIKTRSGPRPKAHVAKLQKNDLQEWEVVWYGERGAPPEVRPATVEQTGQFADTTGAKVIIKFSYKPPDEVDIIIIICKRCDAQDILSSSRIHVMVPLPQNLQGREVSNTASPDMQGFVSKFTDICCGKPKPFPPNWPPTILFRNDISVVAVPYDNPRVREAQTIEDLIDQDVGFVYLRKKPFPIGTTTDCGPNGVWCPPNEDPFYNLRIVRQGGRIYVQFTKLSDPSGVVATLPAEVILEGDSVRDIGITDNVDSPNESTLEIKLPKIGIIVKIEIRIDR
ncbi:hypothetical protein [Thermus sp.]